MSAQPLNTSISVFRTLRTRRNVSRYDSVAAIIKNLRPLVLVVPGKEITAGVLTRDSNVKDFSPYMGQAAAGATRGFPIVVGTFKQLSLEVGLDYIAGEDFAFQIGSDKFLKNSSATVGLSTVASGGDLFGSAQAAMTYADVD
jgi:hypothetical protein